ncbi:fertilization-influencing membrane protein isoform X1 [Acinonyx jubatus]|uniref:Fertilization-influencing membrane protein isoform X1 n=1 Tax=Acinonyx jubatus TaxID=32536 RepID=A0ABM3PC96_ACIJB|nr:fertilization-influencing membrane protein isoform X1 [Acinonyx jubatus]
MRLWLWAWVWVWLLGLGAIETAPSPQRANTLTRGAESVLFLDRPDFFDYPDSDQARLLAVARFIGEKPVIFVNSGMNQLETASFLAGVWRRAALGPPIGGEIAHPYITDEETEAQRHAATGPKHHGWACPAQARLTPHPHAVSGRSGAQETLCGDSPEPVLLLRPGHRASPVPAGMSRTRDPGFLHPDSPPTAGSIRAP